MKTIGSVYDKWFDSIHAGDKTAIQKVGWIPKSLLNRVYTGDAAVMMALEDTLFAYIFPYNEDDQQRTERLITVLETLEQRQKLAFTAIVRKQKRFNDDMHKYLRIGESMASYFLSIQMTKVNIYNCSLAIMNLVIMSVLRMMNS
jgi:sister-chromatid-cohesion protein PDS5